MGDAERGILLDRLGSADGELHVVLALGRGDGDAKHRVGGGRARRAARGAVLPVDSVMPVLAPSSLPRPTVSPACAASRFGGCWPMSRKTPETRPTVAVRPDQFGAVADRPGQHPRDRQLAAVRGVQRLHHLDDRIAALLDVRDAPACRLMPGASWRIALSSRPTPLPCSAEPISTGQIEPARISLTRSLNTLSRGRARSPRAAAPSARRRNRRASRAW